MDAKSLSKAIRDKKKQQGQANLRPDMDYAGQEAVDPNEALDIQKNMEVSDAIENAGQEGMDHEPASDIEMGEDESSQDAATRKRISARIAKYMESL